MIENILLALTVLILSAKLIGCLFERFGLDSSLGELLTGIIFGPSVLNLMHGKVIEPFAILGSVLILFLAGLKQRDIESLFHHKPAIKMGISLLVLTGVLMSAFFYYISPLFGVQLSIVQSLVLGLAFAIIDIGVPAKVLISKGLIGSPVGKITIHAAIINIIIGLFLFTLVTIFVKRDLFDAVFKFSGVFFFILITAFLVYGLAKLAKYAVRIHVEEAEFSLAITLVLALAYFTDAIGFSSVLGAFIAGVIIARMPFAETRSFLAKIESLSFGLFVPLFFVWFGLEIVLSEIFKHLALALLIFFTYIAIRFVIAFYYMKKYKLSMPALVSSSMLSVDVESLVILIVAMQLGIFSTDIALTLFAPSVFLSTLIIVVLVAVFSKLEQKRKLVEKEC